MAKPTLKSLEQQFAEGQISKEDFLYLRSLLLKSADGKFASEDSTRPWPARSRSRADTRRQQEIPPELQGVHFPEFKDDEKSSFGQFFKNYHKQVITLLGTTMLFITMIVKYMDDVSSPSSLKIMKMESQSAQSNTVRPADLRLGAERLISSKDWDETTVRAFTSRWNSLTYLDKQTSREASWFPKFSSALRKQIDRQRSLANAGNSRAAIIESELLTLAVTLGSEVAFPELTQARNSADRSRQIAKSRSEINAPAKEFDRRSTQFESTNLDSPSKRQTASSLDNERITANSRSQQLAKLEAKPSTTRTPEKRAATPKSNPITQSESRSLLNDYKVEFAAGNTRRLIELFADGKFSTERISLSTRRSDFDKLFNSTLNRRIEFNSSKWNESSSETTANGTMKSDVIDTKGNITDKMIADVSLTLRRVRNKVLITDFRVTDKVLTKVKQPERPDTAVAKAEVSNASSKRNSVISQNKKPAHPTRAELQDLLVRYIDAYQEGNIDKFISLFSRTNWSRKKAGLEALKFEYTDLFQETSDRQIFINNLSWSFKKNKAIGTGNLIVMMQKSDESDVLTQKGKIRIVAERKNNKVQFTQLFHIVDY